MGFQKIRFGFHFLKTIQAFMKTKVFLE